MAPNPGIQGTCFERPCECKMEATIWTIQFMPAGSFYKTGKVEQHIKPAVRKDMFIQKESSFMPHGDFSQVSMNSTKILITAVLLKGKGQRERDSKGQGDLKCFH